MPTSLQFRDFQASDLPSIAIAMGDAQVTQFYGLETPHTDAQTIASEQLDWYTVQTSEGDAWWQAICMEGKLIGAIGVYDRDEDGDSAELGYWLLPSHWGQGVMRCALRQWLPRAFERLALHSVVAYVEPDNQASIKLLTHTGFTQEGLLRECTRRGTRYVSLHRLSLLVHEL
ncbi:GNAT family N-acetyltransferase [Comamonas sp. Y33R10-2]|uniref:GNAT family N-acetyltransferase n=1 Tax=Comamonas sp. Y33R10-2 TaxID=2853257 RepID=UPI001C5CAAE1|nr:GNAT family protein [Comamonas sp. Y33R10-2]QXZ09207.1 GNAT family N-acetyltransferase [Comamonas sp. Y33R10-2]